jgi:archaellum component FlaF (FlaF/FlaG flagellin family)
MLHHQQHITRKSKQVKITTTKTSTSTVAGTVVVIVTINGCVEGFYTGSNYRITLQTRQEDKKYYKRQLDNLAQMNFVDLHLMLVLGVFILAILYYRMQNKCLNLASENEKLTDMHHHDQEAVIVWQDRFHELDATMTKLQLQYSNSETGQEIKKHEDILRGKYVTSVSDDISVNLSTERE